MAKKKTVRKMTAWAQYAAGAVTTISVAVEAIDKVRGWFAPRIVSLAMEKALSEPMLRSVSRPDYSWAYMLALAAAGVTTILLVRFLGRHWESKVLD